MIKTDILAGHASIVHLGDGGVAGCLLHYPGIRLLNILTDETFHHDMAVALTTASWPGTRFQTASESAEILLHAMLQLTITRIDKH